MRIIMGVVIGAVLGSIIGYYGKCVTGTCPLTSTPVRGALYGAFMGFVFSSVS